MANHRHSFPGPMLPRRDAAIAVAAFAVTMGVGSFRAMAESRRASQPVTVKRPPASQPRSGSAGAAATK